MAKNNKNSASAASFVKISSTTKVTSDVATKAEKVTADKLIVSEELAKEMLQAGVHFGHKKSRWNPKMEPYIYGLKNDIHIIDLEKTIEKLNDALNFIKEIAEKNGKILFIGTHLQAQALVEESAQKCRMPYVVSRWIGGLLSNFKIVRKRIDYLIDLEKKQESGELKKYTKKEQKKIEDEIIKLTKKFGGLKNLENLPDAILALSAKEQKTAIKEAKIKNIPIIALVDTDTSPIGIDYIIPSNDESVSAIKIMLGQIEKIINPVK
jgi:small subunit ribosomal protein S2